ncbi:MAG: hypothetical protein JSV32_07060 [Dehalococcoidia bacterium]|nr:MAG: hypothetical protein JSV32_07060 [Dehalococcoidia bacterium]
MSRFIDKLKQLSQIESQPMGFRREKVYSKPRLMLVVEAGNSAAGLTLEGADVVLVTDGTENLPKKSDIPVGIRIYGGEIDKLPEGIDFIVFQPDSPVFIAQGGKTGKVIALEASMELDLLRSLDDLPLDAIVITREGMQFSEYVNWRYLMLCRRFATMSSKPVLASVSPQISRHELQLLWEVGVVGVVVSGLTAGGMKTLRSLIDELILPSKHQRQEIRAIVPKIGEETTSITDIEDDEDYL